MKVNTSKKISCYTQGRRLAARVLLIVGLLGSCSLGSTLAASQSQEATVLGTIKSFLVGMLLSSTTGKSLYIQDQMFLEGMQSCVPNVGFRRLQEISQELQELLGSITDNAIPEKWQQLTDLIKQLSGPYISNLAGFEKEENEEVLYGLNTLILSKNNISNLASLAQPGVMCGLSTLDLSENNISDLTDLKQSGVLSSLSILDLSHNSIRKLPPLDLSSLSIFNLSHNSIRKFPPLDLSSLSTLDLSHNSITNLEFLGKNFPYLTVLKLSHNPLGCESLASLTSLKHLKELVLRNISCSQPLPFRMESLERIDLSYNHITNITILSDFLLGLAEDPKNIISCQVDNPVCYCAEFYIIESCQRSGNGSNIYIANQAEELLKKNITLGCSELCLDNFRQREI